MSWPLCRRRGPGRRAQPPQQHTTYTVDEEPDLRLVVYAPVGEAAAGMAAV